PEVVSEPETDSEWVQPVDRQTEPERELQDIKRPKNTFQPELALPPDQDILSLKDATLQFPEKNIMINMEDTKTPDQMEQHIVETEEVHDNRQLELHEDELFAESANLEPEEVPPLSLEAESDSVLNLRLPELTLDIHVYDASQSERFVYINMQKYREGDLIEEGFFVESIDSKGVILDLDGERFRLPIDQ
ncbi:MAG: general secretion pathway protein GspB, partial [Gammaproteobacteria bacterium]|nr:general secretion pathway protein GspB [Gammaproteobacteria bacterium]